MTPRQIETLYLLNAGAPPPLPPPLVTGPRLASPLSLGRSPGPRDRGGQGGSRP